MSQFPVGILRNTLVRPGNGNWQLAASGRLNMKERPYWALEVLLRLAAVAEFGHDRSVSLDVGLHEIRLEPTLLTDHLAQATAGVMITLVRAKVLGEVLDTGVEQCDLDFGSSRILLVLAVLGNDLSSCGHIAKRP